MTSHDRKFIAVVWKWHHAVRMLFTFFWSLPEVSSSKMNLENAFFVKLMYMTISRSLQVTGHGAK